MVEHFDAIVIGSGFGGSVSAYRLADAGLRVCVLERGSARPPGTFPRAPHDFARSFWDPSAGLYGMFNVWFFRHVGSLVSSTLGGGSVIYSNVLLRKDERWFVHEDLASGAYEHWPLGRADLEPHYAAVEAILRPQRYPPGLPYDQLDKIRAFREAAQRVANRSRGCTVEAVPLAVSLYNDPAKPIPGELLVEEVPNRYGVPRRTCTLCGECSVGCNYGSKNTLDLTYLSRAERMLVPAEVRTNAEVRAFRPRAGGGYEIDYVVHDPGARAGCAFDTSQLVPISLTCDRLVLAAGTFGTTYLLLRNAAAFPALSREHVGTRFSSNGDMLSFALACTRRSDERVEPWPIDPTRGPPITHALRHPDVLDGDSDTRGFYLQDAGIPPHVAWMLEGVNTPGWLARGWRFARRVLSKLLGRDLDTDLASEISDFLGPMSLSSRTLPLLGMGRDTPDGRFHLDRDRLQLDWTPANRSAAYYDALVATTRELAEELGADYRLDPIGELFDRTITAHPLGGCPMGRNRFEGVADSHGRVFGHPGLAIVDGSVMPGPVGANPSLTIAAIADRASLELATWKPGAAWPL